MGLMQIMPVTWTELRSRYRLGVDPYDPHDNISAGTVYIRELHDRYGAPGFLAAYSVQDLDATNVIWRPVGRQPTRPWRTSRRLPRSSRANRLTRRP
jgi:hypothetical protein